MTLQRNRSNLIKDVSLNGERFGVFYYPIGETVYSAHRAFRFVAVFDTRPIVPSGDVSSWKQMKIDGTIPQDSAFLWLYVKSAETANGLDSVEWRGPYINPTSWEDISSENKKIICIRAVFFSYSETLDSITSPLIDKLSVSATMLGDEGKFFTKTFDLGFVPKHVVVTYNGDESSLNLVQFALAGAETINEVEYQIIEPNKIVSINEIPELAQKMKLMVKAAGTREDPYSLDCFAIIVGGDGKTELNQQ